MGPQLMSPLSAYDPHSQYEFKNGTKTPIPKLNNPNLDPQTQSKQDFCPTQQKTPPKLAIWLPWLSFH